MQAGYGECRHDGDGCAELNGTAETFALSPLRKIHIRTKIMASAIRKNTPPPLR
jgi:hypothetical protein